MADVRTDEVVELDSNFLIDALRPGAGPSAALHRWVRIGARIQISAIAWSEYLCGPLEPTVMPLARKLVNRVEPFTEEDAELSSELFIQTGRRSRSHVDCMIAAHAIRRSAVLATLNKRDFRWFEKFNLQLA
jgi:predicted nucleic acid-binding protein